MCAQKEQTVAPANHNQLEASTWLEVISPDRLCQGWGVVSLFLSHWTPHTTIVATIRQ